jgi:hypothetical protein
MGETILEAYIRKNPRSAELYPKFAAVFPTGARHDRRVADPHSIGFRGGRPLPFAIPL